MKLTFIAGGRGAAPLITAALCRDHDVSVIENAYDDGKSTGNLRRLFNILGPSDIRKTQQLGMEQSGDLETLFNVRQDFRSAMDIEDYFRQLVLPRRIHEYMEHFYAAAETMQYCNNSPCTKEEPMFPDMSLANCVYAGAILHHEGKLSTATKAMAEILNTSVNVIPCSDDVLWLAGVANDGTIYKDEASIVETRSTVRFSELFLLNDIRVHSWLRNGLRLSPAQLRSKSTIPELSREARYAITRSDAVIIGPGTLHSSQYPTMMHKGFTEAVIDVPVYVVTNAECDNPMPAYQAETIIAEMLSSYGLRWYHDIRAIVSHEAPMGFSRPHLERWCSKVHIGNYTYQKGDKHYHNGSPVIARIEEDFY